jgi:hypothetical protein
MDITYYGLNIANKFAFIEDKYSREYLQSAHQAITSCELWDWLRDYNTNAFMWDRSPEVMRIREKMCKDPINGYHSGASYGWTMRQMESVAKIGYDAYKEDYMIAHIERLTGRSN